MLDRSTVGFHVGKYDRARPLVIDPTLVWAKIVGGSFVDPPNAIALDSAGNPYVTGFSCSGDFAATTTAGPRTGCDAFVTKLNDTNGPDPTIAYTTIFGGSSFEQGFGIAVDGSNAAYVAGQTFSPDMPAATGSLGASRYDGFVAKLNPDGTLAWSKYIGGNTPTAPFLNLGWTIAYSVAIPQVCMSDCPAYAVGQTTVTDLPATAGAVQNVSLNLFDAFLAVVSPDGQQIPYLTYFSGLPGPYDVGAAVWAYGVAVDGDGKAYVDGGTQVLQIPTTSGFTDPHAGAAGGVDCWAAKFDVTASNASTPLYSRFLGGGDHDECRSIALDPGCVGNCPAYLTGFTYSADFPTMPDDVYQKKFGAYQDAFVTKLDASGSIAFSTFLGGIAGEGAQSIAVDASGEPYIIGAAVNSYPILNPVQGAIPLAGKILMSTDGGSTFSDANFPASAGVIDTGGLLADPSGLLYAFSFETGVQISADSGQSWVPFSVAPVTSAFPDPNDPSIFYSGEFTGFFKSTDGGASFNPTTLTATPGATLIDPSTDPSTVYVGTTAGGASTATIGHVFKSIDAGATFQQLPGLDASSIFSLALDSNDGTLYAGTSRGLYRTSYFAPTGSLVTGREFFASSVLHDGTVLVTGGSVINPIAFLSSAEIYSPLGGGFTSTGSMGLARRFHTQTTLSDGSVLVAGGFAPPDVPTTSAEIYSSGSFTPTATMNAARGFHTATLMNSGNVLVAGGDNSGSAEVFDGHNFTSTVPMNAVRSLASATLLANGTVLVTGGNDQFGNSLASAEIFDGTSWTPTIGAMNVARTNHSSTLLSDGTVLIAGGENAGGFLSSAEIYDPAARTFATTGSMRITRTAFALTRLPNGTVLASGGNSTAGPSTLADLFVPRATPSAGRFNGVGNTRKTHVDQAVANLLTNGRVLLAGGNNGPTSAAESSAELFDPDSFGFEQTNYKGHVVFQVAVDSSTNPSTEYAAVVQGLAISQDGFNNYIFADFLGGEIFYSIALDTGFAPAKVYAGDGNGEILSSFDQGAHVTVENIAASQPSAVNALATLGDGSTVFAAINSAFDAYVSKLSQDGKTLLFSSFIGGSAGDYGQGIAVGTSGSAYVTGGTASADFNSAAGELAGRNNTFIAKLPNTLMGDNQTTQAGPGITVTFPTVTSGGNTVAATSMVGPQLPTGFQLLANYTDVTTTSMYTATDQAPLTVCIQYNPGSVTDPTKLSLLHFETNQWVNVTTSNNATTGVICGGVTTLSPFAIVQGKPIAVAIAIKPPAASPVSINLNSAGVLPVAILSSATFDATSVNPASILLDGDAVQLRGKSGYQCTAQDVNGDKRKDLVCQMPTNQFQLIPGSALAVLTGSTNSGQPLQGREAIRIVKQ